MNFLFSQLTAHLLVLLTLFSSNAFAADIIIGKVHDVKSIYQRYYQLEYHYKNQTFN